MASLLVVTSVTALRPRDEPHDATSSTESPHVDEEELEEAERQFHLNLIKQKIVWYLRRYVGLGADGGPPARVDLPQPLLETVEPSPSIQTPEGRDNILLTQSVSLCKTSRNLTAICVSFTVNTSIYDISDVASCDLHLNRTHWGHHRLKVTPIFLRPDTTRTRRAGQSKRVMSATGWVTLDMRTVLQSAVIANDHQIHLQLLCTGCNEDTLQEVYRNMVIHPNQRPYLELLQRAIPVTRKRRTVNLPINDRCRKIDQRVYFHRDLNLTYIVNPEYYDANYCKGLCGMPGQEYDGSQYDSTMRTFMRSPAGRRLALIKQDCCVATTVPIFIHIWGSNSQLEKVTIPDMQTYDCKCRH